MVEVISSPITEGVGEEFAHMLERVVIVVEVRSLGQGLINWIRSFDEMRWAHVEVLQALARSSTSSTEAEGIPLCH